MGRQACLDTAERTLKILYSFWGFVTPFEKNSTAATPDHYRGGRVDLIDEMIRRGHTPIQLQDRRDNEPYKGIKYVEDWESLPDGDVLFVEWRWPTWKNSRALGGSKATEPDYDRQCQLLDYYSKIGTRVIIHDGDLKMTPSDEMRWPNAILADACISPRVQTRPRISMPWCSAARRLFPTVDYSYNYTYVGNNYDRDPQFRKYYGQPAVGLRQLGVQTTVWGNWLERSLERRDPANLVKDFPFVAFGPRLSYKDIFRTINSSVAVTHITRDDYTPYGNITMRFTEAIQAGVVGLVPVEYKHALPVGLDGEWVVSSQSDVVDRVRRLSMLPAEDRSKIVDNQEIALRSIVDFSPSHKVDIIEGVARGELGQRNTG